MNAPIDWVKKIVRASYQIFEKENEKKEYFIGLEQEYLQFSESEKRGIRNIMLDRFEVDDIMFVFSNILWYMKVKDFQEDAMKNILRGNFDYFTGSLLKYQSLVHVKGEYKKKRMLNKRNMVSFQEFLEIEYPYLPVNKRNKKRIVIVTGQLLGLLHSPTLVLLNIAYALQECLGYEVILFVCPCDGKLSKEFWYKQCVEDGTECWQDMPVKIVYRDAEFRGYQISMDPFNVKEYCMMFSIIYGYNPLFVLNADTTNSVVDLINNFTTLVAFTMSIECPISEGDILLRLGKMDDKTEQEYLDALEAHQKQIFLKERFPVITKESKSNYTRLGLGLPEKQFLIAIVGNRLELEVNEELILVMKTLLERVPNIAFAIIGNSGGVKEYFADKGLKERIYYLGYCSDLIGVYKILDLYMNPKRAGGGYSGGMALQAGLPVITLPDCDVAYNCGSDFVVQNYEKMIETICCYVNDQNFYQKKKMQVHKYNEEDGDKKLIRFVEELLEGVNGLMK